MQPQLMASFPSTVQLQVATPRCLTTFWQEWRSLWPLLLPLRGAARYQEIKQQAPVYSAFSNSGCTWRVGSFAQIAVLENLASKVVVKTVKTHSHVCTAAHPPEHACIVISGLKHGMLELVDFLQN
jgi:hypothetical protein